MKKYLFIALALLVVACEKPVLDEDIVSMKEANVILHMTQFEQESFGTRAATDITELCSRHVGAPVFFRGSPSDHP